jgi:hypothetical protein
MDTHTRTHTHAHTLTLAARLDFQEAFFIFDENAARTRTHMLYMHKHLATKELQEAFSYT